MVFSPKGYGSSSPPPHFFPPAKGFTINVAIEKGIGIIEGFALKICSLLLRREVGRPCPVGSTHQLQRSES